MNKNIPDKWVRKAIFDRINNVLVDGVIVPCYDSRVTGSIIPSHYVLMTTQTNDEDKANKCEHRWNSSILLDVFTSYSSSGNIGSRLLADNISDAVRDILKNLTLDPLSNLVILTQRLIMPNDLSTNSQTQIVFRKLMRYELTIN